MFDRRFVVVAILVNFIVLAFGNEPQNVSVVPSAVNTKGTLRNGRAGRRSDCSFGSKELCMVAALARIAKVQVADPNSDPGGRNPRAKIARFPARHQYFNTDGAAAVAGREHVRKDRLPNPAKAQIHCRAIRDIYIAEVKQKLPAFACKYGDRMLVLSSERFLEDRRASLNINVEQTIARTIQFGPESGSGSRSNAFSVIPALLVLRDGEENYNIRAVPNSDTQRANYTETGR